MHKRARGFVGGISFIYTLAMVSLVVSLFCGVSALTSVHIAHAQVASTDPIDLDVEPQYPAPYQTITITPSSGQFDMTSTQISVTVNGQAYYKGSGQAPISLQLGGPGSTSKIVVNATNAGLTYTKSISITPESVALVVEPISSTHPFYAGEGLVPSEGRVRLVAIPDLRTSSGKQLDPTTLTYTWKLGDQILQSDSGIGQSVLNATAPERYQDADVSVTVASPDGSLLAEADTTISPVDPIVRIYENDPLMGPLYDNALSDTFTMTDTEDTYRGVAYYFSDAPTLTWTVNGTGSGSEPDITVRSSGNGTGSAVLSFEADDNATQETANSTLSVNFGQASSGGLFGL
jgi:ribosomal protein L31